MTTPKYRRVSLQAANGKFVCATGGGGAEIVADRAAAAEWETFTFVALEDNKIAIMTVNGHYFCAEKTGTENLNATRTEVKEWETFELCDNLNGTVSLRAVNGKLVSAIGGGGGALIASASQPDATTNFKLYELRQNRRVRIKAGNGKYVCAHNGGGSYLIADRAVAAQWETFTLVPLSYNTIALQTCDGRFVQALQNGGGELAAGATVPQSWETFRLHTWNDNTVSLTAGNGQYVSSENGVGHMTANHTNLNDAGIFTLEEATLGWDRLGGALLGAPSVVSSGPGRIEVFARGTDQALWMLKSENGVWGEWTRFANTKLLSDPVAVSWGTNHIDVFFRGENDQPQHVWWLGSSWSSVSSFPGATKAALGAAALGQGRLRLYHRGLNNQLFELCLESSTWSENWNRLDGYLNSAPSATSWRVNDRLDVFFRGLDDKLWHEYYSSGVGWQLGCAANGPFSGSPTVCTLGEKQLLVFIRGWDGSLHLLEFDGRVGPGWHADVTLGSGITSEAAALPVSSGVELFARGVDGSLLHAKLDNSRWPVPNPKAVDAQTVAPPLPALPVSTAVPMGWMAALPGYANKTFADICVPHTHDAGTSVLTDTMSPNIELAMLTRFYPNIDYDWLAEQMASHAPSQVQTVAKYFCMALLTPLKPKISRGVKDVVKAWGRAQGRTLGEQLRDGVRWLDLRVCAVNGELRTHHGMAGRLLSDQLAEVRDFVNATAGEVVILEFGQLSSLSNTDHATLFSMVASTLGTSTLFPRQDNVRFTSLPFRQITGTPPRSRVIAIYDKDFNTLRDQHPSGTLFWEGSGYALTRNTNGTGEMLPQILTRQRNLANSAPADAMVDIDWTYTPADWDVGITGFQVVLRELGMYVLFAFPLYGLEVITTVNNLALAEFVKSLSRAAMMKIHRINIDFPERSLVAPLCVALSSSDYDAVNRLTVLDASHALADALRAEILGSLRRIFDFLDIGKLLKEAAEIVLGFMRAVPGLVSGPAAAAQAALALGFSQATAAFAIAGQYFLSPAYATRLLTTNAEEAARILRDTFERPAAEVYSALVAGWGATEDAARSVMGAVGYSANVIDDAVGSAAGAIEDFFDSLF